MVILEKMADINFFKFESLSENFAKLYAELGAGNSCSVFGVQNSMRPAMVSNVGKKCLFLTADLTTANFATEQFELMGLNAILFPSVQDSFLYKKAQSNETYIKRTKALYDILCKNFDVVVAPIDSLFNFLPSIKDFSSHVIKLSAGQNIDVLKLELLLVESGYKKEELISEQGQFSRRGEVLDVFPIGAKHPFRIDFFDTEIETIKVFDVVTQKGTKEVKTLKICPYSDLFLTNDELEYLKTEVDKLRKVTGEEVDENVLNYLKSEICSIRKGMIAEIIGIRINRIITLRACKLGKYGSILNTVYLTSSVLKNNIYATNKCVSNEYNYNCQREK